MIIKLRPYHLTYIIANYGLGHALDTSRAKDAFNRINRMIIENYDHVEIKIVQGFDDVCDGCTRIYKDRNGSVWGSDRSCESANDPDIINDVNKIYKRVLNDLELKFGSIIGLKDLVPLMAKKIPHIDDDYLGGLARDKDYQKGLADLFLLCR